MEENHTITARLMGADDENGNVRFEEFRFFCDKLSECIHRVERVVTNRQPSIRFRITSLENKSAGLAIEAVQPRKGDDCRLEVVGLFHDTIFNLQRGHNIDKRLSLDDLMAFRDLYGKLRKTKQLWFNGKEITSQFLANIDVILGKTYKSEGSVKGRLESLNIHNKCECVLYPPVIGTRVVCTFPEELFEDVRSALKNNVTLFGTLYHKADKGFPERVHIREIVVHKSDECPVSLRDLKGSFGNCTGGLSALEFVRKIRDVQE